jgi:hypothetical protein
METTKLIFDFIKSALWPLVAVITLLNYGDQLMNIISTREVDVFGVKIGQDVSSLSTSHSQEIADLKKQISQQDSRFDESEKKQILDRLERLGNHVQEELSELQTHSSSADSDDISEKERVSAKNAEVRGFQALLDRDVIAAIGAFDEARTLWPGYHNVGEIYALLHAKREKLTSPSAWSEVCHVILEQYAWGMPVEFRDAIRSSIKQ